MSLLCHPKLSSDGCYQNITPKSANWEYVGFQAHELAPEQTLSWIDPDKELVYIFLSNGRVFPDGNNTKLLENNIRTEVQKAIYNSIIH